MKKNLWNIIVNGISASYLFNQDMRLIIYKIFRADIKRRISSGVYLEVKI